MSETKQPEKTAGFNLWRFLGSVVMELKTGSDGKAHLAVGMTRIMVLAMLVALLVMWFVKPDHELPDGMLEVFWTLLGLKGVNKVTDAVSARK